MRKIILDTNFIVSALIQKSYPYLILENCLTQDVILCLSEPLFIEYFEVLKRPKFSHFSDFKANAEFLLTRLSTSAEFYEPEKALNIILDEPDNRLLELAEISKADFLITGNSKDFTMSKFKSTTIISPKEYWENYIL